MGTYDCTNNTGTIYVTYSCTNTATTSNYSQPACVQISITIPPPRRFVVRLPRWSRGRITAWVKLINEETATGWKVDMVMFGEIIVCDPSIECIKLEQFLPMLMERATAADKKKIKKFVK